MMLRMMVWMLLLMMLLLLLLNLRLLLLLLLLLLLVSPLTCISWHRTRNKLFSSHTQVGLFWYKFICSNVPLCLLSSLIPLLLLLLLPLLVMLLIDCLLLIQTTLSWSPELVVAVLLLSWMLLSWVLLSWVLLSRLSLSRLSLSRLSLSATAISLLNFSTSTTLIIPCQIVIPRRPTISIGSGPWWIKLILHSISATSSTVSSTPKGKWVHSSHSSGKFLISTHWSSQFTTITMVVIRLTHVTPSASAGRHLNQFKDV